MRPRSAVVRLLTETVLAVAVLLMVLLPGDWLAEPSVATAPAGGPAATGGPPLRFVRVVALGDSVTAGFNCLCAPFPTVYAGLLQRRLSVPVEADNEGVSGLDSAGLLAQLTGRTAQAQAVASADVVVVTIGANDLSDHHQEVTEGTCQSPRGDCIGDAVELMQRTVETILRRVHELRRDRPTSVLVTGYWNVFEDGQVAREAFPHAGVAATRALTRRVNDSLRTAATTGGATYVDLLAAFDQASRNGDLTALLAPDGDHPDAAGHQLIARTLLAAGLPGLDRR